MRDDELSRVPKSIEPWRVMEFLRELGITPEDVYETTIGVREVTVRMYATDEKGRWFRGEDGSAAEHVVSVAYSGPRKKPEPQACGHVSPEGGEVCELPEAHYFHRNGGTSWPHGETSCASQWAGDNGGKYAAITTPKGATPTPNYRGRGA